MLMIVHRSEQQYWMCVLLGGKGGDETAVDKF